MVPAVMRSICGLPESKPTILTVLVMPAVSVACAAATAPVVVRGEDPGEVRVRLKDRGRLLLGDTTNMRTEDIQKAVYE